MSHGVYVEVDLERVRAMRDAGSNLRQIAVALGVSYSTLGNKTAKAQIYFNRNPNHKKPARRMTAKAPKPEPPTKLTWEHYLHASQQEESMPRYLRGRAAAILHILQRAGTVSPV